MQGNSIGGNRLPAMEVDPANNTNILSVQDRHLLSPFGNRFTSESLSGAAHGLSFMLTRPRPLFPLAVSGGFERSGSGSAPPSSATQPPPQTLYPLHSPNWSASAGAAMLLGTSQPPVVLPSLSLALQHEGPVLPRAPEPPETLLPRDGDELSDDSVEARATDMLSARRSRGRPRGAKDKHPRAKRSGSAAAPAASEGASEGTSEGAAAPGPRAEDVDVRGRDVMEPAADRRPPRRARRPEPGEGHGDGGEAGAPAGGEGCGRRKPWKIVLSAQDALDIYRCSPARLCERLQVGRIDGGQTLLFVFSPSPVISAMLMPYSTGSTVLG